jgi:hypothetical protein
MPEPIGWAERAAEQILSRVILDPIGVGSASRSLARIIIARIIVAEWIAAHVPPYDGDDDRADGACVCTDCGLAYRDHPDEVATLSDQGYPFLKTLCDGSRVKL